MKPAATIERFETARMVCERLRPDHADALSAVLLDPLVLEWTDPGGRHWTQDRARRALTRYIEHWDTEGFGIWLLQDRATQQTVGRGGLQFTDAAGPRRVEIAWTIVPERWGQGLATEMAHVAIETAFGHLELDEVIALTLPHNVASRRVMEKTGFTFEREIACDGLPHVLYRQSAPESPPAPLIR